MTLGGNQVQSLGTKINQTHLFCEDLYSYSIVVMSKGDIFVNNQLNSVCAFLLDGQIQINGLLLLEKEETVQIENEALSISCVSSAARVLVVGAKESQSSTKSTMKYSFDMLKKVEKPWGYEIWITGEHPLYCLKKIFIKKGTRTSLQYHNQKRETNVLFEGEARLYYKKDSSVKIENVTESDIVSSDLESVSVIDVYPLTIHRLEAVSDILLFEASTPQLDDVVRISDDSKRGHGRIESEHAKK